MANEQIFDTIISPDVKQQLADTAAGLALLDKAFIETTKNANALNEATANSKSPAQFAKNAEASNVATKAIVDNNEKTRLSEIRLQQAREKAFDDYEKKLQKQTDTQNASAQKQIANQAKIDAANAKSAEPLNQLKKAYQDSAQETGNLAVAQGKLSQAYLDSNEKTKALKQQLDEIKQGYGDNTGSVGKYENALNRLGGILTSRVFRLAGTFLITDLVIKGTEALYKYIAALNVFNPIASAAEQAQAALDKTFSSADYTKGIEGLEKLQSTIDLQKTGFTSADDVINQYNETIGKSFGAVDTLTQAQQGFIDKSKDYIRAIELEGAANILLGQTSQFTADILTKNQKLQDDIDTKNQNRIDFEATRKTNPDYYNQQKTSVENSINNSIVADKKDIADNLQREQEYYANSVKALDNFYSQRADLVKKNGGTAGATGTGSGGSDPIADLRNKVANQALEKDKAIQQAIIDNEKAALDTRIAAVRKFGEDEKQIAANNATLQIKEENAKGLELTYIDNDLADKRLTIQNATDKKIQELEKERNAKAKAELMDKLKIIKDNEEIVLDSESSTYQERLDAISKFQTDSNALINKATKKNIITGPDSDSLLGGISKDALTQTQAANDKLNELLRKRLETALALEKTTADNAISVLQYQSDKELSILQDGRDKQAALLDAQYKAGKISKKKYNDDLLSLDDQYNIDRLGQIAFTAQAILETRQGALNNSINKVKQQNPTDINELANDPLGYASNLYSNSVKIADLTKNSGVPEAQKAVAVAGINVNNAVNKQKADMATAGLDDQEKQKQEIEQGIGDLQQLQEDGSKAIQQEYQHEIDLLEQKRVLIEDNSKAEIDAVNNSILSEKDKQNRINVINAQTAAQEAQITAQQNAIKTKEAELEKAQNIASIIENTAVAITKTIGETGIFGVATVPIIAALGAAQLATVIAQPLPKFEKGGLTAGGGLIWGERGMEMATLPSGERMFSPGTASYANMPKGTVITPHLDLLRMVKPDKVNYSGGESIGWRDVVQAIERNKHPEQKRPMVKVNVYPDRSGYLRR